MSAPAKGLLILLLVGLGCNLSSIYKIIRKPPTTTRNAKGIEYTGTERLKNLIIGRMRRV
jgi:hypothetical protein